RDFHVTGVQTCALPIWPVRLCNRGRRLLLPAAAAAVRLVLRPQARKVDGRRTSRDHPADRRRGTALMAEPTMLIDGQWVPAVDGDTYDRLSPFDGHLVSTYANGDSEDARRGIAAARAAFDAGDWRRAPVQERAAVLRAAAARLRAERDRLARLLAEEIGQPRQAGAVEE